MSLFRFLVKQKFHGSFAIHKTRDCSFYILAPGVIFNTLFSCWVGQYWISGDTVEDGEVGRQRVGGYGVQNFPRLIGWTSLQIITSWSRRLHFDFTGFGSTDSIAWNAVVTASTEPLSRNTEGDGSKEMLCDKYPLPSNNGIGSSSKEVLATLTRDKGAGVPHKTPFYFL